MALRTKQELTDPSATAYPNRSATNPMAADEFDGVVDVIRSHETVTSVDVTQVSSANGRTTATLVVREAPSDETPLGALLSAGFLPLRPTLLEHGKLTYDLLFEAHEDIAAAVGLLGEFGSVTTEHSTQDFQHGTVPSTVAWQSFRNSITPAQREPFRTALAEGYFENPRQCTLEDLGAAVGITKATACHHLREIQRSFAEFIVTHFHPAPE
ncbi:helix-turn-helix domain-containing protein [Haloarculaceae archaeon H-GB2-1]|nr:helix-turn-helix domain-containing protein [Haloarculaceae archaeon H-GB1-1]MEA5387895.1 helix-turn-helix domain-containing protein [Haloarculaceae archaeon H-GB11]MEA5409388.1 helix-turn-helix domain-containing protein [Haloarculaceae archaeon H-GB2-1]